MSIAIEKVAVLGAGTMGAAIAAHIANAGLPVLLLDIVPRKLTAKEEKKGLTLEHEMVRSRIARDGLERIRKLKPASFMSQQAQSLVQVGNLEDDLDSLAGVDWIVEAIIENLEIKRQLMARVDAVRKPGSWVTTNTSGLPISKIAEGLSDDFRKHFFGTHFFNPPRYMKLLEVIRGDEADPLAVSALADFASRQLGKGVVFCKDEPNFIGNRILSVHGSFAIDYGLSNGYSIEEVDALTGPLIGRPKTATFRLQDLVGIDVATSVARNLHDLIPDDEYRDVLASKKSAQVIDGLIERGRLGNKTKAGFYRKGKNEKGRTIFEVLNPSTFEYGMPQEVQFDSVTALAGIRDLSERLKGFYDERWDDDRGAAFVRALLGNFLSYSAARAATIAYDLPSIDSAIRWGFAYEKGPFELWDLLGVGDMVKRMNQAGVAVAPWVRTMLDSGCASFYERDDSGRAIGYYDWKSKSYRKLPEREGHIVVDELRHGGVLESNKSASLHDLGDGVLLLEFHSKMNAIDGELVAMMRRAHELLDEDQHYGLVIGNDGANFCVGANLVGVGKSVAAGDLEGLRGAISELQQALAALRSHSKPVVAAVHGMALGGGAEIALGVDRIVAYAESYIGLVEVGVGLLPAGGGLKELVRRVISLAKANNDSLDVLPMAQRILETVAMAKVSTSAAEAGEMGFLAAQDRVVMNRELLLSEARQEVLAMVADGYMPPPPAQLYAGGRDLLAALRMVIWSLQQAGWASEHDGLVADRIAQVIAGGDSSAPSWTTEDHFLQLEADGFVELVQTEKTQARMQHMLTTGKPLRN